ncbi:MAG: EAL domain-containing protein, partial [Sphingopyxis sp.]
FDAVRKLQERGGYAAFVQRDVVGVPGEFVHHLMLHGQRLSGQVEWVNPRAMVAGRLGRDALTGLLDRDIATSLIDTARDGPGARIGASLIQLAGLDRYNDVAGRAAGDALLRAVGRQLDRVVRQDMGREAIVARVGGSRFAVLLAGAESAGKLDVELRAVAASLNEALLTPAHRSLAFRIATGLTEEGESVDALLGRLALRLVAPRSAIRPLDVESAMAKGELTVRFQPQFDINSNALCGAEALARWQHPKLGDIGGAALFSAAGSAGLQAEVSATIWRAAMQAMAQWPATLRGLRVALNATAVDLSDPTLAARLLQMAHHYGVATERLALEVTESSTISQLEQAAANLTALRQAGVHVALDDFGTGYSGLSWLKQLPVDYIKIDSGFARDAGGAPRDRAVLSGIIDLARGLSLDVLAEGVESEQQRDQLAAMGCRWYQGFLRAPALESADFLAFAATA